MKQPLGIVAVLYTIGVLLGNYVPFPLLCLLAISVALFAAALLTQKIRRYLLWTLFVFLGWTNLSWHTAILSPTDLRNLLADQPELATVRGTLIDTPDQRIYPNPTGNLTNTTAQLKISAIKLGEKDWQPASGKIEAIASALPENFFAGQQVEVSGVIAPPATPLAKGLFDFHAYLLHQEIYFELKAKREGDWQLLGPPKTSPPLSDRFAKWAARALTLGQPPDAPAVRLQQALTLGDKTFLDDQLTEPFVQAATFHIFAVDGLRMAILFFIFFETFRLLRIPRTISGLILIPLIWFYVDLTGWPASAIRAAVMLTIIIVGWTLRRPSDVLNSLFAAAIIILVWQPQQLFQAGFQLSFCVVLCILLLTPKCDAFIQSLLKYDPLLPDEYRPSWQRILQRPLRYFAGLVVVSLAAWIGSIPLVAYYFHIFTPISTLANLPAVFLCIWVLASNIITLLLAGWLPAGAILFNHLGSLLMHWIHASSIWFAKWPYAYAYIPMPSLFTIFAYYIIFIAISNGWLFQKERRSWRIASITLLLALWCGQYFHYQSTTRLTVLPLNGGTAIYCDFPAHKNDLLINCGDAESVESLTKPFLQAQGVNSLPRLALTHGDTTEVGGFETLQQIFPIKKVLTSPVSFRSPAYRKIIDALDKNPSHHEIVSSGNIFNNWTVLHPYATNHFSHAEDNALVLRGEIQRTSILLLSSLGRPGQEALLNNIPDLHAEIVVAGIPDQAEPLKEALLDIIQPKLIIIADSDFPATKRATHALRDRLQKRGIPVLYTSDLGAIELSFRLNQWKAETVDGQSWSNRNVK